MSCCEQKSFALRCRTLADEVDPLTRPAFAMPEDALPPLQVTPVI